MVAMRSFVSCMLLAAGLLAEAKTDLTQDVQDLSAAVRDLKSVVNFVLSENKELKRQLETVMTKMEEDPSPYTKNIASADYLAESTGVLKQVAPISERLLKQMLVLFERTRECIYSFMYSSIPPPSERPENLSQNITIEERVSLLEIQVVETVEDTTLLFENDNFLFDEQVIQDERLLSLEQNTLEIILDVEDLEDQTLSLDFRVTALEENGGGSGNSSQLEERVETLEETTGDHETRLTAAEENVEGLQVADVNLDAALEESGGGGGSGNNATIAFYAVLTSYETILNNDPVLFNEVITNQGDGYDSSTGAFTVPSGGNGFYYFSAYFSVDAGEFAGLEIRVNDEQICSSYGDEDASGLDDYPQATCSGVVSLVEGDEVNVVKFVGTDDTPVDATTIYHYNGFSGFRI